MTNSFWSPAEFTKRLPNLQKRQAIFAAIRSYFSAQNFYEVQTPALQISPGMETHIMAFETKYMGWDGADAQTFYLHTSPEFSMKKLLAAGAGNIFQICPTYRNRGEHSQLHQPEFQMLEWYRSHAGYKDLFADCIGLVRATAIAANITNYQHGDISSNPFAEWQIISVAAAFQHYAGIDLYATTPNPQQPDRNALAMQCKTQNIYVSDSATWEDLFFKIMGEKVEPFLGSPAPTILYDYPASMAALARKSVDDPMVCERFELFVAGIELGNAFGELTDAAEQRRRFEADMALKDKLYGIRYPIDEDFLAAVAAMPPAAGIALGVDRLIMLSCNADNLADILWVPVMVQA